MKHSHKITFLIIAMFFLAQLIGIYVVKNYSLYEKEIKNLEENFPKDYKLPYGLSQDEEISPIDVLFSIIFSIIFAVFIIFLLMQLKAETFLRAWFLFVVTLAIAITINSLFLGVKFGSLISLIIALPIAIVKIYRRNILVHNLSELVIYPGIAAIFVPLLNVFSTIFLLIFISLYDIYAVWHAGFMQKMAKYQIQKLRLFSGFFVPYINDKDRRLIKELTEKELKKKKVKVHVALLGGGDVVFPIIVAGVVLFAYGIFSALIISIGATLALSLLLYFSEKGKFYPAMPFISAGCFISLLIVYLL